MGDTSGQSLGDVDPDSTIIAEQAVDGSAKTLGMAPDPFAVTLTQSQDFPGAAPSDAIPTRSAGTFDRVIPGYVIEGELGRGGWPGSRPRDPGP